MIVFYLKVAIVHLTTAILVLQIILIHLYICICVIKTTTSEILRSSDQFAQKWQLTCCPWFPLWLYVFCFLTGTAN